MGAFPSIADDATVVLSVVVPAYKEEKRITPMLKDTLAVLKDMSKADKCVAAMSGGVCMTCAAHWHTAACFPGAASCDAGPQCGNSLTRWVRVWIQQRRLRSRLSALQISAAAASFQ